jgi:hypothetical protein
MTPVINSSKVSTRQSRDALRRVLDSGFLDTSPKLEEFLRFVVTEETEGRGEEINAQAIAVRALGRPQSFDPRSDPVVRVFAGRLRAALASYYDGPGQNDPVCISIPKGSYRPSCSARRHGNRRSGACACSTMYPARRRRTLTFDGPIRLYAGRVARFDAGPGGLQACHYYAIH